MLTAPLGAEQAIFDVARKLPPGSDRDAYLKRVCGSDEALQTRVHLLLGAYAESDTFLQDPPPGIGGSRILNPHSAEQPGTVIGPYQLLEQIGEGGMGVVYRAAQTEPGARQVALKIIKPGMDTQQVLARFEAERQALALMDHPNIARVLDVGATASGRPYFVMEFVAGQPISKYCDDKQLDVRQRLELMIPVCQAIQHAHQKGIIHRDIKPSNILVAEYDGHPVPKVIDFGVSKAIAQKLTEQTAFTLHGQIIGTLEYMSPEQAGTSQHDIDTRSDVYSLGALLYELLTGTTPFDKHALQAAAFHEVLRIIREEEPPRPSARLSSVGSAHQHNRETSTPTPLSLPTSPSEHPSSLASIAAVRRTEPSRLAKTIRGELDWIVMKALEKDRDRRYETAAGLASDLERYLNDETVEAAPPTAFYRFWKFSRRNRTALATAALVFMALLVGTAAATWQAIRATRAEALARENEANAKRSESRAILGEQKAQELAASEAEQRHHAEQQTQIVESQRKQLEDIDRINAFVVNRFLSHISTKPSKGDHSILAAIAQNTSLSGRSRVAAYHTAGNLFVTMKDYEAAKLCYGEGLKLQPRHAAILISRGDVFFREKEFEQAIADYTSAIECSEANDPSNQYLPYCRRGLSYCHLGQFEQAASDFETSRSASAALTFNLLRLSFGGTGILVTPYAGGVQPVVERLAQRHVLSQNNSAAAHLAMADFFAEIEQADSAVHYVQAAQAAGARGWGVPYRLALLALKRGDQDAYRRICRDAVEHALAQKIEEVPDTWKNICAGCALAPAALDDYTPALTLANRALAKQAGSEYARFVVAALQYRAGQYETAQRQLLQCFDSQVDNHGEHVYGYYVLAMCCQQLGRKEEAAHWLRIGDQRVRTAGYYNWRFQTYCRLSGNEAKQLIATPAPAPSASPASP